MPPAPTRGSNAPCSTLFVANLGSTCTELEVTQAFSRFPGFRKVKMQSRGGLPVAFVEYQDTGCSTQALSQLQNMMLPSSVQGGIRLEYAKARMGQPGRERLQQQDSHTKGSHDTHGKAPMLERQQVVKTSSRASGSKDFVAFGHWTVNDDKEKAHD
ncbi:hypothetical protein L7F22_015321 [Adiantum nelumboides]|nr:hypothetical protein [Adiantum nelumboides]